VKSFSECVFLVEVRRIKVIELMLFFLLSCILEFVLDSLMFWSFWRVFWCMNFNLPGCSHHPRHLHRFVAECVQSTSVGIGLDRPFRMQRWVFLGCIFQHGGGIRVRWCLRGRSEVSALGEAESVWVATGIFVT